ncbi:MAG: shikimate dehydrogenase, partial [Prevotellaceae bacterium]|nr:shikimate dehydrogenase [Prevotellaceae bacterium]
MKAQYGLIGYPLGHSFSRSFFTKKFQEEKIDAEYLNFEIPEASTLLRIIQEHPHLKGVNVTLPHKVPVIPLLHELSPEAAAIGAVNVIRITHTPTGETYLKGFNSDVIGFT